MFISCIYLRMPKIALVAHRRNNAFDEPLNPAWRVDIRSTNEFCSLCQRAAENN